MHSMHLMAAALLVAALSGSAAAAEGWAFDTAIDPAAPGPIDLRTYNEEVAGAAGFIRRSADGADFLRGDGEPIRFWGVAAAVGSKTSDADVQTHARFLARMGVNMVRIGGANIGLMPQAEGASLDEPDQDFVQAVWRCVARMKEQGIYTRVSPFWDHGSVKHIDPDWGIEGYASGDRLNAVLFVEPRLQQAWKNWMRVLLTTPNPHTGIPLAEDPALAIIQVVSEDSLFFWWTDDLHGGPLRHFQERFGAWATERYGSIAAAQTAWGATLEDDDPAAGRLGVYSTWHMLEGEAAPARIQDQLRVMAELERGFYAEAKRFLREELGCKQLVGGSNMGSADAARLDDLQRWCWAAGDVIERNDFFSGAHAGKHRSWRIQAGHHYQPRSALHDMDIPGAIRKQVAGMPYIVSSTCWLPPNPYTMEGPGLQAAYAAMNGVDGLLWFAASAPTFDGAPYFTFTEVAGSHPMKKWTISHPGLISQFPAAALLYRLGLVQRADTVVHEQRTLADLVAMQPPLVSESLEPVPGTDTAARQEAVDPRAFLVGAVEIDYVDDQPASQVADLGPFIDGTTISSTTGELQLDSQTGLLRIDAAAAKGAIGFVRAAGGRVELSGCSIASDNEHASVLLVAMDGQPLATSQRILVQVGTRARPTGWREEPASFQTKKEGEITGMRILDTGSMPWRITPSAVTVRLANDTVDTIQVLDEHGRIRSTAPVERADDHVTVEVPADCMYLVLTTG